MIFEIPTRVRRRYGGTGISIILAGSLAFAACSHAPVVEKPQPVETAAAQASPPAPKPVVVETNSQEADALALDTTTEPAEPKTAELNWFDRLRGSYVDGPDNQQRD